VRANVEFHRDVSIFGIDADLTDEHALGPLEFALRAELERLWASDPGDALDDCRQLALFTAVAKLENPSTYAFWNANTFALDGKAFDVVEWATRLRTITAGDVLALRGRFLHPMFVWLQHETIQRPRTR
jgi:hypothetical protein